MRYRKQPDEVSRKGDSYATVVSGVLADEPTVEEYDCNVSDGEKVYRMIIKTKVGERDKNKSLRGAYLVDCLYRGFSKNHLQKPIRSYKKFLKSGDY